MAATFLMDSNVLIDYTSRKFKQALEQKLDKLFNDSFHYSIISRMEVLGYDAPLEVILSIEQFLAIGTMYHITNEISDYFNQASILKN